MLTLIGLGLFNEKSLTLESLEILSKSEKVYIELYTSKWHGSKRNIEKLIGKKISLLERKDLEENSKKILDEAKNSNVAILIPGDPLVATTHLSLLFEAKKRKIKTRVVHNASIFSAVCETGLHLYKFGPSVTIPFPEKTNHIMPKSVFDVLQQNIERGWHTLCLLDLVAEKKKYMDPREAISILLESKILGKNDKIVVFGKAGSKKPLILYGRILSLLRLKYNSPPFVLIIPGNLHFTEREYLELHEVD